MRPSARARAGARAARIPPPFPSHDRCAASATGVRPARARGGRAIPAAARSPRWPPGSAAGYRAALAPRHARVALRPASPPRRRAAPRLRRVRACNASKVRCACSRSSRRAAMPDSSTASASASGSIKVCSSAARRSRRCSSAWTPRSRCAKLACSTWTRPSAWTSALRAASSASCAARSACSACGSSAFSASSLLRVSPTRFFASTARAAQACNEWVNCARCSRQDVSCARRSVYWLSRRLRVSSAWRNSDSKRATSALAA